MKMNYSHALDIVRQVLGEIPPIYRCPKCEDVWALNGRTCDHKEKPQEISKCELFSKIQACANSEVEL